MFEFLVKNNLISPYHSGLSKATLYISALISLSNTNEIYQSFDNDFEVIGVFLDFSNVFAKVWHKDLEI